MAVLTNLPPPAVDALAVADPYRGRWQIEPAFQELAAHFDGEIATLGYPGAAPFASAVAATPYNAVALVRAAPAAHHGDAVVDEDVSGYHVAAELATTARGMPIAIGPACWDPFEAMPSAAFAAEMVAPAGVVNLSHLKEHPRGPKRPSPSKTRDRASPHVSTHRLIDERKAKRTQAARP